MREDMAKVLVERPRFGHEMKYSRSVDRGPMEERPRREAMKFRHHGRPKFLNENLAPLRRFLRSKVGQRWDAVYSEICQRINRDSAVQLHIWQHLMWEVVRDPVKVAELLDGPRRSFFRGDFYVDRQGRLRYLDPRPKTERWWDRPKTPFLLEQDGRSYKQIAGIWYEIELAPIERGQLRVWDAILSRLDPARPWEIDVVKLHETYGARIHAARKRQLNTREIRELLASETGKNDRGGRRFA